MNEHAEETKPQGRQSKAGAAEHREHPVSSHPEAATGRLEVPFNPAMAGRAQLQLYGGDGSVAKKDCGKSGRVVFEGLNPGKYTLKFLVGKSKSDKKRKEMWTKEVEVTSG